MRIPRLYTHCELNSGQSVSLEEKAHKHVKDVLRMHVGDTVILFNGQGDDYRATISEVSKKVLHVTIGDCIKAAEESPLELHLLQPLCRSDKMDLCIQKATELGVSAITPFSSSRVNVNIAGNRLEKKMLHWESVIQSACEQSGRATLPTLHTPTALSDALSSATHFDTKLIASPSADKQLALAAMEISSCICAIGPEGGFTSEEIKLAEQHNYHAVQLGPRILRLETAVIATITLCQHAWGDFTA